MQIIQQNPYVIEKQRFDHYYSSLFVDGKFIFAGTLLQRTARGVPHKIALICKGISITYQQLYSHAVLMTYKLRDMGIKPRDKVCILSDNSIEYYVGYFGIWQTGAVVVPLNTFLIEKELIHIIQNARPRAIIVSAELAPKLEILAGEHKLPIVVLDTIDLNQNFPQNDDDITIPYLEPDELAALLYTSGTTGFPKGVMLSSRNILTNLVQGVSRIDVLPDDRLFGVLPLFHSFAQNTCVWGSVFVGATTILVPKIDRKWILEGLHQQPTVILGVPALYGLLCLMKNVSFPRVRYFVSGGDALPDKIRAAFELVYRRKLCNGYGLTETSPLIAVELEDELQATSAVGRPSIGIQCSLRDEQGHEVAPGQVGILWVKGDNVMLGYYNAPEATQEVLKDGWLNTGDFAAIDQKGRIIISGRHKDLIINKGVNIYPQEIENVLMTHPAVFKVAVVGKKDEEVGEIPVAFVAVREKSPKLEIELKQLCMQNLALYKVPKQFICLDDLPMTALGKVDKKRLRREYLE